MSIGALEKRDREISEKLKTSFHNIDSQLEGVSLKAATVRSMQNGIHGVVAKQQQDMDGMKIDIERYVANAIATITSNTQPSRGPGERQGQRGGDGGGGGRVNDSKKFIILMDVSQLASVKLERR